MSITGTCCGWKRPSPSAFGTPIRPCGYTRASDYFRNYTQYGNSLNGIESQCRRLFAEIRHQVAKALYRNTVNELFAHQKSPRKRVMTERQVHLLNLLLARGDMRLFDLGEPSRHFYRVKNPHKTLIRDLNYLIGLQAINAKKVADKSDFLISINLEWPTQITETEFFRHAKELPKAKVHGFLSS